MMKPRPGFTIDQTGRFADCNSVYAPAADGYHRNVHHLRGRHGMASLGAASMTGAGINRFTGKVTTRTFGDLLVGVLEHSGNVKVKFGEQFTHKTMLNDPLCVDLPINELANRSGFKSPGKLRSATKAAFGQNPSQLRHDHNTSHRRQHRT